VSVRNENPARRKVAKDFANNSEIPDKAIQWALNHAGAVEELEPYYTKQHMESPEIEMDVIHSVLHKGRCRWCGKVNERQTCPTHLIRRAEDLADSELLDFGAWTRNELQCLVSIANAPPTIGQWRALCARLRCLIALHRNSKSEAGCLPAGS
jgi:hypothetical protein